MERLVYKGFIREGNYGEHCQAIFIGDMEEPLAEELQHTISNKNVSLRLWVSEEEKTKDEILEGFLAALYGRAFVEYHDNYSDYTGYLWTDEELSIGGHDVMRELMSYIGFYVILEIDVHDTK
jgi:hypothetical protein